MLVKQLKRKTCCWRWEIGQLLVVDVNRKGWGRNSLSKMLFRFTPLAGLSFICLHHEFLLNSLSGLLEAVEFGNQTHLVLNSNSVTLHVQLWQTGLLWASVFSSIKQDSNSSLKLVVRKNSNIQDQADDNERGYQSWKRNGSDSERHFLDHAKENVMENHNNYFAQIRDIFVCFRKMTLATTLQNWPCKTKWYGIAVLWSIQLSLVVTERVDLITSN